MILSVEDNDNTRIDKFLSEEQDDLSRSYIQKLLDEGLVKVNGHSVKASYKVQSGDLIELEVPELINPNIIPEDIPLDIVYEDEDVILINKPKGMVVHPAPGHYSGTLVNALMFHCGDSLSGINGVLRPGIVHRIDRDTTGIVIAAKNDKAHNCLAEQLKKHSINRKYLAIVRGIFKESEGTIDANIARSQKDRKKMAVVKDGGRTAVTHYTVLETFREYSFVECRLETGRTHQIRVHMSSIGHSVLGDEIYGPSKTPKAIGELHLEGQCLHAQTLGFVHPNGTYMEFSTGVPEYFEYILKKLQR